MGAVISQRGWPISYYNEKIASARSRYSTYNMEIYAIVQAIKHQCNYLVHHGFILFAKHALRHLDSHAKVSSCHASWIAYLQQFTFSIRNHYGKSNRLAYALSRHHNVLTLMHTSVIWLSILVALHPEDKFILDEHQLKQLREFQNIIHYTMDLCLGGYTYAFRREDCV